MAGDQCGRAGGAGGHRLGEGAGCEALRGHRPPGRPAGAAAAGSGGRGHGGAAGVLQ